MWNSFLLNHSGVTIDNQRLAPIECEYVGSGNKIFHPVARYPNLILVNLSELISK